MAQGEEPLAKSAGAEMNSVSPLIAVALSEPELRSSHPHPAGAPRSPPEPARRGIDRLDVGRPRVKRSSAHAMPETVAALTTSSSDVLSSSSLPLSSLFSSSPLLPS
jgi:hypothetical protein